MALQELMRLRLQTLARMFTGKNDLTVEIRPGTSNTDFKKVYVNSFPGEIIPGVPASREEIWLAQKAANAHEAGHIKFTDQSAWQEAVSRGTAFRHLVNIIEDARVERAMSNAYPGLKKQFRFYNEYVFLNRKEFGDKITALFMGLLFYAKVGRIPEAIASQKEILGLIKKASPAIDRGRTSPDTWGVLDAAQEVWEVIQDFAGDNTPDMPLPPDKLGTENPVEAPRGNEDPRRKPRLPEPAEAEEAKRVERHKNSEENKVNPPEELPDEETPEPAADTEPNGPEENGETGEADDEPGNEPGSGHSTGGTGKPEEETEPEHAPADENKSESKAGNEPEDGAEEEGENNTAENNPSENFPDVLSDNATDPEADGDTFPPETEQTGEPDPDEEINPSLDDPEELSDNASDPEVGEDIPLEPEKTGETGEPDPDEEIKPFDDPDNDICPGSVSGDDGEIGSDADELIEAARAELENMESKNSRKEKGAAAPQLHVNPGDIEPVVSQGLHKGISFKEFSQEHLLKSNGFTEEECRSAYNVIKSSVAHLVNKTADEIKKALEYRASVPQRNLRRGRLDGGSLWKLKTADPRVFFKVQQPGDVPTLAVYLLVDVSGSMGIYDAPPSIAGMESVPEDLSLFAKEWWFAIHENPKRITRAVQAATTLAEVCGLLNIPYTVVGFSTGYFSVLHYRYVKWGEKENHRLALMTHNQNNRDGYSIRAATRELLSRPDNRKILIVLSDGKPNDFGYRHLEAVNDTAKAVREAEKQGIGVIGIFFGDRDEIPIAQKIYNNFIYAEELAALPVILGRLLKKIILN